MELSLRFRRAFLRASWYSVAMSEDGNERLAIPPRRHFQQRILIDPETLEARCTLSGHLLSTISRLLAPSDEVVREMLIRIRTAAHCPRGQMAAILGASESTIKAWETGARKPSIPAKRLIWLVHRVMKNGWPENALDWATWGNDQGTGAKAAREEPSTEPEG
jgi:DNA-binding transcriptional regulator YiaG